MDDADSLLVELAGLLVDDLLKDGHDAVNFVVGAAPVFGGECVEGDELDAAAGEDVEDGADLLNAGAVSFYAGQATLFCPSTIAVHNDGDVTGSFSRIATIGIRGKGLGTARHPLD